MWFSVDEDVLENAPRGVLRLKDNDNLVFLLLLPINNFLFSAVFQSHFVLLLDVSQAMAFNHIDSISAQRRRILPFLYYYLVELPPG